MGGNRVGGLMAVSANGSPGAEAPIAVNAGCQFAALSLCKKDVQGPS